MRMIVRLLPRDYVFLSDTKIPCLIHNLCYIFNSSNKQIFCFVIVFTTYNWKPCTSLFAAHSLGNIFGWHIYPHLVYSQDDLLWLIVPKSQWMVRNVDGNYLLSVELTDTLWRTTTLYGRLEWWSEFKRDLHGILLGAFHAWCRKMLRCLIW